MQRQTQSVDNQIMNRAALSIHEISCKKQRRGNQWWQNETNEQVVDMYHMHKRYIHDRT